MAHSTSGIDRSPSRALLLACGLLASLPTAARAESDPRDRAIADALFREGKTLLDQGETKRACAKLAESHRLDPRGGTLLNLAHCHETEGKLATALLEYEEALEMAFAANRTDRITFAQTRMDALKDKVPKLIAHVPSSSRVRGLEVRHNGALLPNAAFGTPLHVDPGQHTLVASAPGSKTWTSTIRIDVGETATLTVPSLTPLVRPPLDSPLASQPAQEQDSQVPASRVAGYSLLGAGLAGLGVGLYFGSVAFSRANEREEHCSGTSCDARGMQLDQQGASAATVANIGFGVAALGLGTGAFLLLQDEGDRPQEDQRTRQLRVAPVAGRNGGGLSLGGTW